MFDSLRRTAEEAPCEPQRIKPRPRITAVVNSGPELMEAVIQIKANGMLLSAHTLPYANKKKPLRFCVGQPSARSSFWSAFANRGSDDVYIGIRSSAHLHKISLHESGDFRYQLIGMSQETLDQPNLAFFSTSSAGNGRILHRWDRPAAGPEGWTDCLSIVVPTEDLEDGPARPKDLKDVIWIPSPPKGRAVEIRGFLVEPSRGEHDLRPLVREEGGFSLLGGFKLARGQVFVMLSATVTLPSTETAMLEDVRRSSRSKAHPGFDWSPSNHPRALAFAAGPSNYPTFFDLRA